MLCTNYLVFSGGSCSNQARSSRRSRPSLPSNIAKEVPSNEPKVTCRGICYSQTYLSSHHAALRRLLTLQQTGAVSTYASWTGVCRLSTLLQHTRQLPSPVFLLFQVSVTSRSGGGAPRRRLATRLTNDGFIRASSPS